MQTIGNPSYSMGYTNSNLQTKTNIQTLNNFYLNCGSKNPCISIMFISN